MTKKKSLHLVVGSLGVGVVGLTTVTLDGVVVVMVLGAAGALGRGVVVVVGFTRCTCGVTPCSSM